MEDDAGGIDGAGGIVPDADCPAAAAADVEAKEGDGCLGGSVMTGG